MARRGTNSDSLINDRPSGGAGSESGTEVPEPMWDRGTGLSQLRHRLVVGRQGIEL